MQTCRRTAPKATAVLLAVALLVAGSARAWATGKHRAHASQASSHSTSRSRRLHHSAYRHGRYSRRSRHHHAVLLGQRTMDSQRAVQIQEALVQAHYLSGSPTGEWDAQTQAAMEKYQADNGWQTKITPDSRALIKLGLGPKQDEGEYATVSSGVSKLSGTAAADPLSTMATAEMPTAAPEN